jgi:uncharacterized protein
MQMQGQRTLAVSQQQAWDALNDPAVLQACVPGCERFEATGDNAYKAVTAIKIGPVSAKFTGKLNLSEIAAPRSYTLSFEGSGAGGVGFGNGKSTVRLSPQGAGSLLEYTVDAQVGGKIAQLGQRLIDGVAKSMADDFFKRFEAQLLERHPDAFATKIVATNPANTSTTDQNDSKNGLASLFSELCSPPWTYGYAAGAGAALMLLVLLLASR